MKLFFFLFSKNPNHVRVVRVHLTRGLFWTLPSITVEIIIIMIIIRIVGGQFPSFSSLLAKLCSKRNRRRGNDVQF